MGELIHSWVEMVFGNTLANNLSDWADRCLVAIQTVLTGTVIGNIINVLAPIACSLLIIYFFQNLLDQASKDMFSFEKLVVSFIKLFVAFAVLIYLKDIMLMVTQMAQAFVSMIKSLLSIDGLNDGGAASLQEYNDYFNHLTKIFHVLAALAKLMIPWLISFIAEIMGKFLIASTSIMLMVRMVFCPIAVAQLFEDGSRSSGMRYLKGLFADAISLSVMVAIIILATKFSSALLSTELSGINGSLMPEDLMSFGFSDFIPMIVPKLVIAGGLASASKIAHDVVGA